MISIFLFYLLIPVVTSSIQFLSHYELVHPQLSQGHSGYDLLSFYAFQRSFAIKLTEGSAPIFPDFKLTTGGSNDNQINLFRSTRFYNAQLVGESFSSGFITTGLEPGSIYGKVDLLNDSLVLEPFRGTETLVYWESAVNLDQLRNISATKDLLPKQQFSYAPEPFFARYRRQRRESRPVKKNRCEVKLVADYDFYATIGNYNYANAARYLINMITRINQIFRPVDWGQTANGERLTNLGFTIKEMKIYDQPSIRPNHFNTRGDNRLVNAIDMLNSFSRETEEGEGCPSPCLTILITGKGLDQSILGLANIGYPGERGVCAKTPRTEKFMNRNIKKYMNTAVISVKRRSGLMITRVVDLVVAHEIGHTWGSYHDDPQDPLCVPADSPNGRFIMHESSNSGFDSNNYKFSPCSIQAIHRVLYHEVDKCFVDEQKSLCGNGILEPGEQCDPGGQLALGHTQDTDTCCTSKCKLRPKAVCSPRHSECCSPKCTYSPSSRICQAHNNDTCRQAGFCSGTSDICPEPKPVVDGTVCADEGQCREGECIAFCELHSPDFSPCICENVADSCKRCCRSADGICQPYVNQFDNRTYSLQDGAICIQGHCKTYGNVTECEKEVTDAAAHFWRIIKDISGNPSSKHVADYIVFITLIATLLIWCPCGAFIVYRDRMNKRVRVNASNGVEVINDTKRVRRQQ